MQQFQLVSGKNSTDSAMIIDAMDILTQRRADVFVLVTSDSDFTRLANRIREDGLKVIGVGRKIAPASFVKGCDEFVLIESLMLGATPLQETKPTPPPPMKADRTAVSSQDNGKDLLVRAVKNVADENGMVLGAALGIMLRKLDPSFRPINYGVPRLIDFVRLHQDVLKPTDKWSGGDRLFKVANGQADAKK